MRRSLLFKRLFQDKKNRIMTNGNFHNVAPFTVSAIFKDHILINNNDNQVFKCEYKNITDIPNLSLSEIFDVNKTYKFLVKYNSETNTYSVNYKSLHPELIRYKLKPIPTESHYRNLYGALMFHIKNYKL